MNIFERAKKRKIIHLPLAAFIAFCAIQSLIENFKQPSLDMMQVMISILILLGAVVITVLCFHPEKTDNHPGGSAQDETK